MAIPVPLMRKMMTRSFNTLNCRSFDEKIALACLTTIGDERLICKRRFTQLKPLNAPAMQIYYPHFFQRRFLSLLIKDLDSVPKTDARPFLHPVECKKTRRSIFRLQRGILNDEQHMDSGSPPGRGTAFRKQGPGQRPESPPRHPASRGQTQEQRHRCRQTGTRFRQPRPGTPFTEFRTGTHGTCSGTICQTVKHDAG